MRNLTKVLFRAFHAFQRAEKLISTIMVLLVVVIAPSVHAISVTELNAIVSTPLYDPTSTECSTNVTAQAAATTTPGITPVGNKVFYVGDSLIYHLTQGNKAHTITGDLLEKTAAAAYSVDTTFTPSGLDTNSPRVSGKSIEAQGGIDVAASTIHLAEHPTDFDKDHANIVVIGLGTNNIANSNTEKTNFGNDIDELLKTVRANNDPAIYWINGYWPTTPTSLKTTSFQTINDIIAGKAAADNFHIIDYAGAAALDATIAPDPYVLNNTDGIHVGTKDGRQKKAAWIVAQLPKVGAAVSVGTPPTSASCCSLTSPSSVSAGTGVGSTGPTIGDNPEDGNLYHVLTYPGITDEVGAAKAIDDHIRSGWPTSPFLGLGGAMVLGGKKYNVNPFLAAAQLQKESQFAIPPTGGHRGWYSDTYSTAQGAIDSNPSLKVDSHNAFGWTAGGSQATVYYRRDSGVITHVRQFDSWEASLNGDDAWFAYVRRNYLNPDGQYKSPDFATYIHHYAPNSDGNNEAGYVVSIKSYIDDMTKGFSNSGSTTATAPTTGGGGGCTSAPSTPAPAKGDASKYNLDCASNDGNAAIACTAINQLSGVPYPPAGQNSGPTVTVPQFLDCSALVNMAIYRTFGVKLGLCSAGFRTDSHFKEIDVHDIQAGDLVGIGSVCHSVKNGDGHIAIVVSYDKTTKKLLTMEASSTKWPSGVRGSGGPNTYNVGLVADGGSGTFEWAVRYTGTKTLQPGAL